MKSSRVSTVRYGFHVAFGASVGMVLFAVACGSPAVDAGGPGGSDLSESASDSGTSNTGTGTGTTDAGALLFDDAGKQDGAASTACPADAPNQQGCTCTPGTKRACYSGAPSTRNIKTCHDGTQTCVASGELSVAAFGPCEGETLPGPGECVADCTPGAKQCDGQQPQTCDESSAWTSAGAPCAYVCSGGECIGTCTPGSKQCDGQVPKTCDANGDWVSGSACPYLCSSGECAGACVPGTKRCNGLTAQTCDANSEWQSDTTCPYVCQAGACTGSCVPSSKQCSGTTPQTCNGSGNWTNGTTCSGSTNQCENGTCVCAKDPQGPSSGTAPACSLASLPSTLHVTISGVSNSSGCPVCSCFKGTFTLTKSGNLWTSGPITGCPGQSADAYIKFNGNLGITSLGSAPGSGQSELFPTFGGTCAPLNLIGGRATAGNNTGFCSDAVGNMNWVLTE